MSVTTPTGQAGDAANDVVERLLECIDERVAEGRRENVRPFARAYARRLDSNLVADPEELCSEVIGAYELAERRGPEPAIVRAFVPTLADDGYELPGSVVETNTPDAPFLVDSVMLAIEQAGYEIRETIHPVVGVERGANGGIVAIGPARESESRESVIHVELTRKLSAEQLEALSDHVRGALDDVQAAVGDYEPMLARVNTMIDAARASGPAHDASEIDEVVALLNWLRENNFVFLGFREYALDGSLLQTVEGAGLGILRVDAISSYAEPVEISEISPGLRARLLGGRLLVVSKTNSFSSVHRRGRMDDITVVATGPYGNTIGAHRLLGLFTSKAYSSPAGKVPILRHKLHQIATLEDYLDGSHDHKRLVETFESFPMDELFAATVDELRPVMVDLLELQERRHVEVYLRPDIDEGRVSAIVVVPRERFSGALRKKIEVLLTERLGGTSVDYHLAMSESSEARMHFSIYVPGEMPHASLPELERTIVELSRTWDDRLYEQLVTSHGEDRASALVACYGDLLPEAYKAVTDVDVAVVDLEQFERLSPEREFTVGLRNQRSYERDLTRVGLYKTGGKVRLSDFLPILEDLGLSVVEEVPTRLRDGDGGMYLHDIGVLDADDATLDLTQCADRVADAITAVRSGAAISDSLNRLVITGGLSWRQVSVLRAYRTYRRRLGVAFTESYENDAFARNPAIARKLIELFELRFDPDRERDDAAADALAAEIGADLDAVKSLDEDRILRGYLGLVDATLRTNAFLPDREYLSFKFASELVPDMPAPKPLYEIFVQSPQMEGIHLRGGRIARGGIRWSDRIEDYRTEILGLMKAQMVKNVVIVPVGSKGGFVLRYPPEDREARRAAVEAQYRVLICGLLDLTDNRVGDGIVHPDRVVVRDDPDPYLVVAADRGTATFSDTANELAAEYGFWLDDAFASGGSIGYDHKELGITARGAWESVKRHFRELGIDFEGGTHTTVGIGDMSGDVFGNGLLYSDRTRLIAAFDHRDIFIDPDPDPALSHAERKRLFEQPRSTWADYDVSKISAGGGVWSRAEKRIELPSEAREALGIESGDGMAPSDLAAAILCAPVDLIWNGGIGTFVKASYEENADVGDRANDAVRVDGGDLRARVIGEGGNLGLTQKGRIEYAQAGGHLNIDAIDNSGGVDASDHEVNLKILLGIAVREEGFAQEERDALLREVETEVADLVLYDNYLQAQIVSQEAAQSAERLQAYEDLMLSLEEGGMIDRGLESLPTSEQMTERMRSDTPMFRPELCVLLSYAKFKLELELRATELLDDPLFRPCLLAYFPEPVRVRFGHLIERHPLRRELLSTIVSNIVVNSQGITFASRLSVETGASLADVVRAYWIARTVTDAPERWSAIEALDGKLDPSLQNGLMVGVDSLVEEVTRWYLDHDVERSPAEVGAEIAPRFAELAGVIEEAGSEGWRKRREHHTERLIDQGVGKETARRHVSQRALVHGPALLETAESSDRSLLHTAEAFFLAGEEFRIDWLERRLADLDVDDRYELLAVRVLRDDLRTLRRDVAAAMLASGDTVADGLAAFAGQRALALGRLERLIERDTEGTEPTLAELTVFVRQLRSAVS